MAGHRALFYSQAALGDLKDVRWHMSKVEALYDRDRDRGLAYRLGGADPKVATFCQGAWFIWALGYANEALRHNMVALTLAREINHPFSEAAALSYMAGTHLLRGEASAMQDCVDAMRQVTADQTFAIYEGWTHILRGQSLINEGATGEAVAQTQLGVAEFRAASKNHVPFWMALLAKAHIQNGQFEEGMRTIDLALEEMTATSQFFWESELCRTQGVILQQREDKDASEQAEACFRRALRVAHAQSAKSWEMRAALSIARLWCARGKRTQARDLLAPIYGWFTEGFETQDLREAKALLDSL